MTLPKTLNVRPVALQGRLEQQRYKKADDGIHYEHDTNSDLWLVELRDGRRATMAIPRRGNGWMSERGTTWLTNAPERGAAMAKKKRAVPKGFSSWKAWGAHMKRLRTGGGRKRRASSSSTAVARPRKRAASRGVVVINSPRKRGVRRGGYRRNPDVFTIAGILSRVWNGAIGGATIVGTEAGVRLFRGRVLKMKAGETLSTLAEVLTSTTAGLLTEKFVGGGMGSRFGQLIIDAGFASAIRATVKQSKAPWVADALADDSPRRNFEVRNGRVVALDSYVRGSETPLEGRYVAGRRALGGYVRGAETIAANMQNGMR